MGGISIWQLLIIAVIVVLLFGTKNSAPSVPILARRLKASKKQWVMMSQSKIKPARMLILLLNPLPISRAK